LEGLDDDDDDDARPPSTILILQEHSEHEFGNIPRRVCVYRVVT
jgi:hypothetical protein